MDIFQAAPPTLLCPSHPSSPHFHFSRAQTLDNIQLPPSPPRLLTKPEPLRCLLAHQVRDDGLSIYGLSGCPPTARVRTHAKDLSTLSQAAKWASAQAPTVYHALQLLWVPDHLHTVTRTPATECVGPRAKDLSPGQTRQARQPPPAPQPSPHEG